MNYNHRQQHAIEITEAMREVVKAHPARGERQLLNARMYEKFGLLPSQVVQIVREIEKEAKKGKG